MAWPSKTSGHRWDCKTAVSNGLFAIGVQLNINCALSSTGRTCKPTHVGPSSPPICKTISKDVESVPGTVGALHGDFVQLKSWTSTAKEGVVVSHFDRTVSATGSIVPHGKADPIVPPEKADPKDVKTVYVHFHTYGNTTNSSQRSFLLLPMMRSSSASDSGFVCPIKAEQTVVSVLCANEALSAVEVKELDLTESTDSARNCLWFQSSVPGARCRLFVRPDDVRKLYMASDGAGKVFLTEDEQLSVSNEGQENPQTYMHLFLKGHDGGDH